MQEQTAAKERIGVETVRNTFEDGVRKATGRGDWGRPAASARLFQLLGLP